MAIAALSDGDMPPANPIFQIEARTISGRPICSCTEVKLSPHLRARLRLTGLAKSTRDQQGLLQAAVNAGADRCSITAGEVTILELCLSSDEAFICEGVVPGWFDVIHRAMEDLNAAMSCSTIQFKGSVAKIAFPTVVVQRAFATTLRASQERTNDADAAVSVVSATRIEMERFLIDNPDAISNHVGAITLAAWLGSVVASNRVAITSRVTRSVALPDEPVEVYSACGQVVATRTPVVKPAGDEPLRDSVEVVGHDAERIEKDEQSRDKCARETPMSVDRVIGPAVFPATTSIDANTLEAELSGVQRHLNKRKQLQYREENLQWLEAGELFMEAQLRAKFAKAHPHDASLPEQWGQLLRDTALAGFAEDKYTPLKGFVKPREVGLPEDKPARLIGTQGPERASDNAQFISPIEKAWKECFPGAVTKGLTVDELDQLFRLRLAGAIKRKTKIFSCDFSAMDSTWQLHEKRAILRLFRACVEELLGGAMAADFDRVMVENDVRCSKEKIKWKLKFTDVLIAAIDALLFSGERLTSIGNRYLVVLLRTSELLRLRGEDAAAAYWRSLAGEADEWFDIGDGDDTAFESHGEYIDVQDVVSAYEGYAKHIEPIVGTDCLEVLSRYTLAVKDGFVHLAKLERNSGRMVYQSFNAQPVGDVVAFTPAERAEISTALLFRAYSMRHTLVLRYYALALARYHMRGIEDEKPVTVDRLGSRGELVAVNTVGQQSSLRAFYASVRDALAEARTSGYSMVRLVHHGSLMPDAATAKRMGWEWQSSDENLRELEICDDDFLAPDCFIQRMDLKPSVVAALKIKPRQDPSFAAPAAPERVEVLCPGHAPPRHLEPPPGLMAVENAFSRPDGRGAQRKQQTVSQAGCQNSRSNKPTPPKGKGRNQRGVTKRNLGGNQDKTDSMATDSRGSANRRADAGVTVPIPPR